MAHSQGQGFVRFSLLRYAYWAQDYSFLNDQAGLRIKNWIAGYLDSHYLHRVTQTKGTSSCVEDRQLEHDRRPGHIIHQP